MLNRNIKIVIFIRIETDFIDENIQTNRID